MPPVPPPVKGGTRRRRGEDLDGRRHLLQLRLKAKGGKQWCTQCGFFITCACGGDVHAVWPWLRPHQACRLWRRRQPEPERPTCRRLPVDDADKPLKNGTFGDPKDADDAWPIRTAVWQRAQRRLLSRGVARRNSTEPTRRSAGGGKANACSERAARPCREPRRQRRRSVSIPTAGECRLNFYPLP